SASSASPLRLAAAETSKDALFGTTAEPASKDALFGTASEPASKDALFGTGADGGNKSAKFSGSFEGLGAYTYSDPAHWSRGVGRLTLSAQGAFTEDVKWKLGGRADGAIVYATSDFYLPAVKRNQRATAIWGENYLD